MYSSKETVKVLLYDLKPHPKNPKKHNDALIEKSISELGYAENIVIDENNVILAGHGRVDALKKTGGVEAGGMEIEAVRITGWTEEEKEKYLLLSNQSTILGGFDNAILKDFGNDVLVYSGFDRIIEPDEKDDEIPENVPPMAKLGDLYTLGNHRVLCGDSTKIEDVERLMDGKKADMVFTDPPYRLQTDGGTNQPIGKAATGLGKTIEFISNFEPADFLNVLPIFFEKNMNAYVFCNKELLPDYLVWARDAGYSFNVLVWKKPNAIPIGDSHRPDIEYLLLFRKNAIWNNGLSQTVNYSRLIESKRETGLHPTMKPVDIITNQMKISSHSGSLIVDAFLGSGSTLIASEKTGRICYGMELDPKYVDVIVKRWEDYTGQNAKKLT